MRKSMEERFIRFKPKLGCLFLHQVYWIEEDNREDIHHCTACKDYFFYPSKKALAPVYEKFL